MNTKKILAVAAVTMLAVPALAAASQIVVPGVQEQVVEGHTVFAVIEKIRYREVIEEAAAVAVLVREKEEVKRRVKGVLWFNDQYLVAPSASDSVSVRYPCGGAVIAVNAGDPDPRTFLASYNGTDTYQAFWDDRGTYDGRPDRSNAPLYGSPPRDPNPQDHEDVQSYDQDYSHPDSELGIDLINDGNGPGDAPREDEQGTVEAPGNTSASGQAQPGPNAWVDYSDPDGVMNNPATTPGTSWGTVSTSTPTAFEYDESYLVTDPNDHSWVVDKYTAITVVSVDLTSGALVTTTSKFPLWVVNILGKPVFTPDDGFTSCGPFVDDPWQQGLINSAFVTGDEFACDFTVTDDASDGTDDVPDVCPSAGPGFNNPGGDANGDGIPADGLDAKPPAIGYYEPTDETAPGYTAPSYCYEGNPMPRPGEEDRAPGTGCQHGDTWMPTGAGEDLLLGHNDPAGSDRYKNNHPLRIYNALLYFLLGPNDVRITHTAGHSFTDTNGCQVGTEWTCPGGDDNAEGNSHPFNPPGIYVPSFTDPMGNPQGGEWYDIHAGNRACSTGYDDTYTDPNGQKVCNVAEEHTTHNRGLVDLYFSPVARPMEPPARSFAEYDVYGRTDVFHENNCPDTEPQPDGTYGDGVCDPPVTDYHPGQPDNDLRTYPRTNYFH